MPSPGTYRGLCASGCPIIRCLHRNNRHGPFRVLLHGVCLLHDLAWVLHSGDCAVQEVAVVLGGAGIGNQSSPPAQLTQSQRRSYTPGSPSIPLHKRVYSSNVPQATEPRWPHQKQVPLSQLGLPTTPSSCPQLHSSYLWSVELQIWELLSFQVSITQETAVLKWISPLQACYPTTPLILPGLQLSPLSCQSQVPSWL